MKNPENGILRFDEFRKANVARCFRFHPKGVKDWTAAEWAEAVVGEVGKFFSVLKKRRRGDSLLLLSDIVYELADIYTYADILDVRMGGQIPGNMNIDDFVDEIDIHLRDVFKFTNGTDDMLETVKGALIYGQYETYSGAKAFDLAESSDMSFEDQTRNIFLGIGSLSLWLLRYFSTTDFPPSWWIVEKFNEVSDRRKYPERFVLLDGEWKFATK